MDFSEPTARRDRTSVVPMINIVFLLLIFFLLSATVQTLAPFDVAPPASRAEAPVETPETLFIAADGTMAFDQARGEAVFAEIAATGLSRVLVSADRDLPAQRLAQIMGQLGAAGVTSARLVVERP
ncbi:MAG: biopolymer transporter ExbD [Pseudomonadota bacterium]